MAFFRRFSGLAHWADGSSYEGDFVQGRRSGEGVFKYADGTSFSGGWLEGVEHGEGVYIAPDGARTEGTWENGKLQGQPGDDETKKEGGASTAIWDEWM